ncbi:hypothetical protein [Streptomyces yerevanensis]|uniref:hypothetical protein n=1 Tax=Streptomyces yerevanensis TaxID=66378 RepID=UPI000527AD7F|nr:hypothetical protein [Streptomyces yerevanensis]
MPRLVVGIPGEAIGTVKDAGAVHALPWVSPIGTTGAVTTYQPGQNGLPAAGQAFGTAIR